MRFTRVLLPLLVVLALLGAACGSSTTQDVVADDGASTANTGPTTAPPDTAAGNDGGESPETTVADTAPATTIADDGGSDGDGADDGDGERHPDAQKIELAAFSAQEESFRGEMFMSMSMGAEGLNFDMGSATQPMAEIAFDGENTAMTMDLGVLLGDLFGSFGAAGLGIDLDPADLRMDMVMTPDTAFLHSPFLGLPGATSASGSETAWMQAAADGWISISIDGLSSSEALADFGEMSGLGATGGVDQFFDLLDDIDDVEPIGPSQVRGVDVEGYRVRVSIEELMALQGSSAEDLLGPEFVDLFEDFEYTFEAYLDPDGRLHAIDIVMDESLFDSFAADLGEPMPSDFNFEMTMRLELFDHGNDVEVVIPFGAVDVTDDFLNMGEGLGDPFEDAATIN